MTDRTPRVLNKSRHGIPEATVYVGRSTKWGNPFLIGRDGDRETVIRKYRTYLHGQPALIAALPELRGRDLVCHCAPEPCHADVLLALANAPNQLRLSGHYSTPCQADGDGYCEWLDCPQIRDGEPRKTGRHCPLDAVARRAADEDY